MFVGKEHTIDELRFMVDRDNFTEEGFNASVLKYAPMFNVQNKHKQAKQANIAIMKFCFTDIQYAMKDNEVLSLVAHKNVDNVFLDYKVKKSDEILKQYVNFAYRIFDIQDVGIDEYIKNINIENRVKSKLVSCGNGINNKLKVKEEWREKIVVFFAFFDSQINTPYYKLLFINKPIVILDLGNSGAIPTKYEQNSLKRVDIIYDIIQIIENMLKNIVTLIKLQENSNETMNLDERIKKANIIKQNTQSEKILFLSLHIDSEESGKVSGMRCFYNDKAYAEQEKRFIECLKKVYPVANNTHFENKSNLYLTKLTNMASVLVTLGFISNNDDKARLNNKNQRQIIANKLFLAISNYIHGIK